MEKLGFLAGIAGTILGLGGCGVEKKYDPSITKLQVESLYGQILPPSTPCELERKVVELKTGGEDYIISAHKSNDGRRVLYVTLVDSSFHQVEFVESLPSDGVVDFRKEWTRGIVSIFNGKKPDAHFRSRYVPVDGRTNRQYSELIGDIFTAVENGAELTQKEYARYGEK